LAEKFPYVPLSEAARTLGVSRWDLRMLIIENEIDERDYYHGWVSRGDLKKLQDVFTNQSQKL